MPLPTNSPSPEQLRERALTAIREASEAIKQYRLRGAPLDTLTQRQQMNERATQFIKEAVAVGGSGQTCGRCGGSGREPGA